MQELLYILLLLNLTFQSDSTCTPYQCDGSSSSVSGCVRKDISSMKLTECKPDYECTGQDLETTDYNFGRCNLLEGKSLRRVNEYCYYEVNCATSYCLNYACSVKDVGDSCTYDSQCGTFMKCFQNQCYERLHVGELCPTSGKELCRELSQCIKINDDFDYTCQALFSVAAGAQVAPALGETVDGTICVTGEINATSMTCYPSVNAHATFPQQCNAAADCSGSVPGTYSQCVCHYINNNGNKYCTPFPSERGTYLNDSIAKAKKNYSDCANWQHILGSPKECDTDITYDKYIENWIPTKNLRGSCYQQVNLTDYIYSEIPDLAQCPKFICVQTSTQDKIDYENCIEYNYEDNAFYLKQCPEGYYCPKSNLYTGATPKTIACVQDYTHLNTYNKICLRNSECYSQICNLTSYKCTYLGISEVCTSSVQCGQNSQCFNGKCQTNLAINSTCTSSDYSLCRPLSQCAFYTGLDYFSCQPLYQLNSTISEFKLILDGERISSTNIPFAYRKIFNSMCSTGYFNQTTKVCSDTLQNILKGYPLVCTSNDDCVSSETAEDGICNCEVNIYGNKYCEGFTADQIPNYFTLYQEYTLRNLEKCFYYEIIYENVATTNTQCNVGKFKHVKNVPEVAIGTCYEAVLGGEFIQEEEEEENSSTTNISNTTNVTESKNFVSKLVFIQGIFIILAVILY